MSIYKSEARPPQGELFHQDDLPPIQQPPTGMLSPRDAFERFHRLNPHIYTRLVYMARTTKRAGRKRCGIAMLFEVLRWDYLVGTVHAEDDFKLNNNHKAFYARLIMQQEKDLAEVFETRQQKQ
jgi:hypothetical protein